MKLTVQKKAWPLREPFVISRATYTHSDVIIVTLQDEQFTGRGEAAGVDYHGETPDSMVAQLEAARGRIEAGITRAELLQVLPIGGARNALDAALWDALAVAAELPLATLLGSAPRPIRAYNSCGLGLMSPPAAADEAERLLGAASRASSCGSAMRPWTKTLR